VIKGPQLYRSLQMCWTILKRWNKKGFIEDNKWKRLSKKNKIVKPKQEQQEEFVTLILTK